MLDIEEIDKVSVDADQADALLHLLDAVVIKLEGGTEEDLQVLDVKPNNPILSKDTRDKEDAKMKAGAEKKLDNRCGSMLVKKLKQKVKYDFYCELYSDASKTDEASRTEKTFKNGQGVDAETKSVEKDENLVEEAEKPEDSIEDTKKDEDADESGITFRLFDTK